MIAKLSRNFNQFLHWWGRELAFLVPDKLRHLFIEDRGQLIVYTENNEVTLYLNNDGKSELLAKLPLNELGGEEFSELCARDGRILKADVILRLTSAQAVKKIIHFPAAVDENLQQVVAYELDKYTPFNADQVYFTVQRLGQDESAGKIKVLLVLTPKETLDDICLQLRSWGVVPLIADSDLAPNEFGKFFQHHNLLPDSARLKIDTYSRVLNPAIGLLLLLLFCSALILPVWIEFQTVNLLQSQMQTVAKDAAQVEQLRTETDKLQDETQQLINSKSASASILTILESLSKLIADDTWLTHFKYSEGRLQIQGQSPGASSLIGLLETSSLFSNVRFVSPVTQDKRTGLERFQISAAVKQIEAQNNADR